jgi:FKBP-type peptidyl-prolyl cis-trans isomerase
MKTFLKTGFLLFTLSLLSCVKQVPQIPANKGSNVDSATVSLLEMNERLALREDSLLNKYVDLQHDKFIKSKIGFWYKINSKGSSTLLKDGDKCRINYQIFLLNGKQLQSDSKELVLGKKEVINGLEEGLKLLHKGDGATLIIPWNLAYGINGDGKSVLPYTSLVYKLKIEK